MIVLCGLPLSGKSTHAETLKQDGWAVVCPDDVRLALHGREYHRPAEPVVWAVADLMARALLMGGHSVAIDATNTTRKRRAPWISIAHEFDIEPTAVVMDAPASTCKDRAFAAGKKHMVPVIDRMAGQWEPIEEEGIRVTKVGV